MGKKVESEEYSVTRVDRYRMREWGQDYLSHVLF